MREQIKLRNPELVDRVNTFCQNVNVNSLNPQDMMDLTEISICMHESGLNITFRELVSIVNSEFADWHHSVLHDLSIYVEGQIDLLRYQADRG